MLEAGSDLQKAERDESNGIGFTGLRNSGIHQVKYARGTTA
jgi:hypothetical protein